MKGVGYDIGIEPKLQALEEESFAHKTTCAEDAERFGIQASGLYESTIYKMNFEVKILIKAESLVRKIKMFTKFHESLKKRKYEQRLLTQENSTFNPLVFACIGSAVPSVPKIIFRLALKISGKVQDSYCHAIGNLHADENWFCSLKQFHTLYKGVTFGSTTEF